MKKTKNGITVIIEGKPSIERINAARMVLLQKRKETKK